MIYDVIIIGAGPAGLTAALYAARSKLKTIVIGQVPGGYMTEAPMLENYPGFLDKDGKKLTENMLKQVKEHNIEIKETEAKIIEKKGKNFKVVTHEKEYIGKTIILCLGSERKKLNVPGEEKFSGKGVTYCFECDAPFFKGKDIAIIGAGDSAVIAALYMLKYARNIYMIDIEEKPRAKKFEIDRLKKHAKKRVTLLSSHKVNEIKGNAVANSIEIESVKTGKKKSLSVSGVLVEIGMNPASTLVEDLKVKIDNMGFVVVDENMKTNVSGIFAAGDVVNRALKQVVTATAQGAIAAKSADNYLQ